MLHLVFLTRVKNKNQNISSAVRKRFLFCALIDNLLFLALFCPLLSLNADSLMLVVTAAVESDVVIRQ